MRKGYSKVLIEDNVLSDQNACSRHTLTDMGLMIFCSGMERTRSIWTELLESNGLTINMIWTPMEDGLSVIEAEIGDDAPINGST
ncbi:uncharacterized protein LDX57_004040 [Aspergillus melleus]|uniref:uncharacterized protein n=1 Tax=Aspergillus melleus TaxID=138277 RepID=UPI001E8D4EA2|nr:uncharacterized protein LDX57_004040 [Aspergillus melleus]KAH8426293.1 hypothetical protein LDX57_004040 [Aspergillus melleus]